MTQAIESPLITAERFAGRHQCGECSARLTVVWQGSSDGDGEYTSVCGANREHTGFKSYSDVQADEIRARLEGDPKLMRQLAVSGASVPLTTRAIQELDNAKLMARIPARYGSTTDISPAQRLQIAQLSRVYGLDPLWDLMIYENKPYVTYDGRLRKLRESADYRGHKVRPLNKEEKDLWGYDPADIVIQAEADMGGRGVITEWGVVRKAEIDDAWDTMRRNKKFKPAPVGSHPQQIALKRAVGRLSRVAVGIDLPTMIDAASRTIEVTPLTNQGPPEVVDPEVAARRRFWATARGSLPDGFALNEDEVHELLGVKSLTGYRGGWDQALSDLTEKVANRNAEGEGEEDVQGEWEGEIPPEYQLPNEQHPATGSTGGAASAPVASGSPTTEKVTMRSKAGQDLASLVEEAARLGIDFDDCRASFPADKDEVARKTTTLTDRITIAKRAPADPTSAEAF